MTAVDLLGWFITVSLLTLLTIFFLFLWGVVIYWAVKWAHLGYKFIKLEIKRRRAGC